MISQKSGIGTEQGGLGSPLGGAALAANKLFASLGWAPQEILRQVREVLGKRIPAAGAAAVVTAAGLAGCASGGNTPDSTGPTTKVCWTSLPNGRDQRELSYRVSQGTSDQGSVDQGQPQRTGTSLNKDVISSLALNGRTYTIIEREGSSAPMSVEEKKALVHIIEDSLNNLSKQNVISPGRKVGVLVEKPRDYSNLHHYVRPQCRGLRVAFTVTGDSPLTDRGPDPTDLKTLEKAPDIRRNNGNIVERLTQYAIDNNLLKPPTSPGH
jgi:hypothetical protein